MEKEVAQILKESIHNANISKKKEKKILSEVHEKCEKEITRKISIKEGATSSVMTGFGTDYLSPFALALNANNAQIGFLSSFPGLISPIAQIFGSRLMEKYSRKKIIVLFVALQALMWLPILALSFLLWANIYPSALPYFLIALYTLLSVFGSIAGPSWFSLMGDLVPEKIRGKYFGNRNKICGAVALISAITAAFLLDFFRTKGLVLIGFAIIFFLASIFRLISANLFKKHYNPEFKLQDGYYFSLWQFIKKAPGNNFGKFVIFISLMQFATAIGGPFFAVYMLKNLNFSYTTFMLVNISSSVFAILFMPIWGKFSDKYGNRELLRLGSILVPLSPILWIFNASPSYLIIVPQLVGGIGWAAFNLSASNFIYDSVSVPRRGICVAYYNVLIGLGVFLGASLGGLLAFYLNISFMNKLLFIFLISGILRALVSGIMLPQIKEIKPVKKPKNAILYFKEIRPVRGVLMEITNDMFGIGKKIGRIYKNKKSRKAKKKDRG